MFGAGAVAAGATAGITGAGSDRGCGTTAEGIVVVAAASLTMISGCIEIGSETGAAGGCGGGCEMETQSTECTRLPRPTPVASRVDDGDAAK